MDGGFAGDFDGVASDNFAYWQFGGVPRKTIPAEAGISSARRQPFAKLSAAVIINNMKIPRLKTAAIMWTVAGALLPPLIAAVSVRGAGALWQAVLAVFGCVLFECLCLWWRKLPLTTLSDGSAVVAGIIIGLSLPPYAPWYVAMAAAAFGMCLGKHCYGGLGNNPFNPAMAGYALAFISFPGDFGGWHSSAVDAVSMPTPLMAARLSLPPPPPSYVFAAACIVGGAILLFLRVADWRLPTAFIGGALLASGGNIEELAAGGLMLAAFFIITDPVTAASSATGRWIYGFVGGALCIILRMHGVHADGIAFAILICNMTAPLMDGTWRRL